MAVAPIHQFEITKLFTIGHIGGQEIAFTNSSAYMFLAVAVISLLMIGGSVGRQLVPGRIQSIAELSYEFVANMIRSNAGSKGMKFFPLVFSLFARNFVYPEEHALARIADSQGLGGALRQKQPRHAYCAMRS
jgi:F-type H+-transporting ATPase subunit a